jgi:hypothetical protein
MGVRRRAVAKRKALEAVRVDEMVYAEGFAKILKELVCFGGNDAIFSCAAQYCGAVFETLAPRPLALSTTS